MKPASKTDDLTPTSVALEFILFAADRYRSAGFSMDHLYTAMLAESLAAFLGERSAPEVLCMCDELVEFLAARPRLDA